MLVNGKDYSWDSLEVAIDGQAFTEVTDVEFESVTELRPMLISVTLPDRLKGVPVEFRHRYESDAEF